MPTRTLLSPQPLNHQHLLHDKTPAQSVLETPRSKHWHQLDMVLTRCTNLGNVKLTRSYQSAECDIDHSFVCCKVNFKAKRVHHAKKEGRHRINTCMTRKPEKMKEFIRVLEEALPCPANTSAAQRWEYLRDAISNAPSLTFGKKKAKTAVD